MSEAAYSGLKAAYHLDRVAALRAAGRCVPAQIQLVLSDLCNHDCPWCAYRVEGYSSNQHFAGPAGERNPRRFIPHYKAVEILRDVRALGVSAGQFTGGGEPTVHPRHQEVFAEALRLGLKCALVTNGSRLAEGWQDNLPRFDWIRVSLDAGTPSTYAKMRRLSERHLAFTIANLRRLAESIPRSCHLGTSFIVQHDNWLEIGDAARLAKSAGAHSMRYAALFSPQLGSYYTAEQRAEYSLAILAARTAYEDHAFRVIDMFGQRVGDLDQGRPDYSFCGYQHFNVYIGADLKVYRCCNTAYNDLGEVGSLADQSFKTWFTSSAADSAYKHFNARACEHCAFNAINRTIDYVTGPPPQHVEFV